MPRVNTKEELLNDASNYFDKLWALINQMTSAEQNSDFIIDPNLEKPKRDKNLRDILVHLYEWHILLINFEEANQNQLNKPFLPEPYTWKTYPLMNVELFNKHQSTSLEDAKKLLQSSHLKVIELIKKYNDEELFKKGYFKWTNTTSLGQYLISTTISHYDWAIKNLKPEIKRFRNV